MTKWRIIAVDLKKRLRLVANSKSYHVQALGYNQFAKAPRWDSRQRAPLAIGQEAAARMLDRQIIQAANAHQQIYQSMADSVHESFKRLGYYGGEKLVAATMPKHYHRGAQRGRVTLPQPVTAGSNRGAKE